MVLSGSPFVPIPEGEELLTTDIAPTVMFLMDVPVGRDMHGRVIKPALTDEWLLKPVTTIDSHSREDPRVEQPPDLMTPQDDL